MNDILSSHKSIPKYYHIITPVYHSEYANPIIWQIKQVVFWVYFNLYLIIHLKVHWWIASFLTLVLALTLNELIWVNAAIYLDPFIFDVHEVIVSHNHKSRSCVRESGVFRVNKYEISFFNSKPFVGDIPPERLRNFNPN